MHSATRAAAFSFAMSIAKGIDYEVAIGEAQDKNFDQTTALCPFLPLGWACYPKQEKSLQKS
jgi:hypothetical protein